MDLHFQRYGADAADRQVFQSVLLTFQKQLPFTTWGPKARCGRKLVPFVAGPFGCIDDKRYGETMIFSRMFHEPLTIFRANVCRVNHPELTARQTLLQR
jgi:hypothetical protein